MLPPIIAMSAVWCSDKFIFKTGRMKKNKKNAHVMKVVSEQ